MIVAETPPRRRACPVLATRLRNLPPVTTQGQVNFPADYAGKWVVFFSHPADFTPVCTSEFMALATMQQEFAAYNTELVGLSVDGIYSHIAWLRTIKDQITFRGMRDVEVTFPPHRGRLDGGGCRRKG